MRIIGLLALVFILPGCAVLKTDCAQERAALRHADAAIAEASRGKSDGFSVRLASRGYTDYTCVTASSGQVHCAKQAATRADRDSEKLYRHRDALAARVSDLCAG